MSAALNPVPAAAPTPALFGNAMKLFTSSQATPSTEGVLAVDNTADVLALSLDGVQRIDWPFPRFADGRGFS